MATKTNRTSPVRNTNNNGASRAVRTADRATVCTRTLKQIEKRGESLCKHLSATYEEVECIAQSVNAVVESIQDGEMSANKIIAALRKIEDRIDAVNGRLNYTEITVATLAGDAGWIAEGNNLD